MNWKNAIEAHYINLSPAEKTISTYILKNSKSVSTSTITSLSEFCDTSPAGITRFIKKIGFSTFVAFKLAISKDLCVDNKNTFEKNAIIQISDSIETICKKIYTRRNMSNDLTYAIIKPDLIEQVAQKIKNAHTVYIFGIGISSIIALDLQFKLQRLGKKTCFYIDSSMQLVSSVYTNENDIAIGISYSGKSLEVISAIQNAKSNKTFCITITRIQKNPLRNLSDIALFVPGVETEERLIAFESRESQLMISDMIFFSVYKLSQDIQNNNLAKTRQAVSKFKFNE